MSKYERKDEGSFLQYGVDVRDGEHYSFVSAYFEQTSFVSRPLLSLLKI